MLRATSELRPAGAAGVLAPLGGRVVHEDGGTALSRNADFGPTGAVPARLRQAAASL